MKFEHYPIDQKIKDQLKVLGFNRPTDIQYRAINHILDGEDVMAVAQTGTGKTAAFVIPVLHRLLHGKKKLGKKQQIHCIVLVPTRELAQQITSVFEQIGAQTQIKVVGLFGGVEQDAQINELKKGAEVLIATPGRMFDLIAQGHLDVSGVQTLVLDEADLMLDLGFNKDIHDIINKIPKKHQTLFFTATINKKIKSLAYDVVRSAIRIQLSPQNPVSKNVHHAVAFIAMDDKRFFLENMIKEYEEARFLVFARTKVRVERIVKAMERVGLHAEALHGGIVQENRFAILDRFRKGENKVLITTDVASRGIDIPNMEYVINYDLPDLPENYVHRCGRTGRGSALGQALSFCSPEERKLLDAIEAYTGEEIMQYEISEGEYNAILFDADDPTYNWQKLIDENEDPEYWQD